MTTFIASMSVREDVVNVISMTAPESSVADFITDLRVGHAKGAAE